MTKDQEVTAKYDRRSEKTTSNEASSIYLWQGFSGNLSLTTFDLFTKTKIKDISFGDKHSLFLTEDGQVFVRGRNDMGQLGTGSLDVKVVEEPMRLKGFSDYVTQISCGKNHNAIVTDIGRVYCWGLSKDGQCGTGSLDVVMFPTLVVVEVSNGFCQHGVPKATTLEIITGVACGTSHTLAVSNVGEVWVWGCGSQLGLGDLKHAPIPRRIDTLLGHTAVAVCCGEKHSMALVLRGERRSSSSSSRKSKSKREATFVVNNDLYPSRCKTCNKDIYTYTDVTDMCIIDTLHECVVSDSIYRADSTIVEDISSSSSSETFRRSFTSSPESESKLIRVLDVQDKMRDNKIEVDNKYDGNVDNNSLLNDSSHLDSCACDISVLVVPAESSFGGEDSNCQTFQYEDTSTCVTPESSRFLTDRLTDEGILTENSNSTKPTQECLLPAEITERTLAERTLVDKTLAESGSGISESSQEVASYHGRLPESITFDPTNHDQLHCLANAEGDSMKDRTLSSESEGDVWKRRSVSEDNENELAATRPPQKSGTTSPLAPVIKSFDLSGAKEYLQRQFEDEQEAAGDEQHRTSVATPFTVIEAADCEPSASFGSVLGYPTSMFDQVKSVTSRALTNIQTLSVFSSSRDHIQGESTQCSQSQYELSSLPGETTNNEQEPKDETTLKGRPSVKRSGTFMEWSRDMASVDDNLTSLTKESDQRSLRTIEMQQKNLTRVSLSNKSDSPGAKAPSKNLVTATDVWVWGSNEHGQLGLGDQVDRTQPSVIKFFWFMKGFTAWDIGAGASHSVFLGDAADMYPDVLYSGKHPSKGVYASVKKTNFPVSLAEVRQARWITKVMAGGIRCACKSLQPAPPESEPMFELAASERSFYNQLIKTSNLLLRPLQKSNFYTSMDVYPFKSSLQNLVVSFGALTKKIGEGITDLTRIIQDSAPLNHSLMLGAHSEFMETFRVYSHSFSDFLSVGGFDYCTRTGSEFFEKIQGSIRDLSDERDKSVAASSLFLRAMRYPFFRLVEYSRIITRIAALVAPRGKTQLQRLVLDWDGLKINFSSEHKMADTTRVFWETAIPKLTDALRRPERRMLRESKTYPLQMPSGGKFTSRLFVLFNDIFVIQSTNLTVYPLETLWIESGTSVEEQANGITILSPEEVLEVQTSTPALKTEWLIALNSAVSKVLANQKSTPRKHSSGDRYTPPLIRHAKHTFVKPGLYKDAVYDGTWLSGKIHGMGTLKWVDGSSFQGNFKRGVMHGSGILTLMKSKGKEVQTGTWKDGKLNGLATVSYENGDLYEGYFLDGQRCGHGMYKSGHHKSSYASVYIGEWLQNLREGYGVHDDILKGEKYMGMWSEDHRHGSGVLVTLDGMYFEGTFVQNKLLGFGVMISDDNTLYEGDFMDITHLSGKGVLTLPTGDKLEGSFIGTLNDGLKVNGTFIKSISTPDIEQRSHPACVKSKYFGHLGVPVNAKWAGPFSHIISVLGRADLGKSQTKEDTYKAWEVVAVAVASGRGALKNATEMSPSKLRVQTKSLEGLDKIPAHGMSHLDTHTFEEMSTYLSKASDCLFHPLGQLIDILVNVFRASYVGIGAHPLLLHHAVLEMKSYIRRLYRVIRILFPVLPAKGEPLNVYPSPKHGEVHQNTEFSQSLETDDSNVIVVTAAGLLYPILLPKIYPPLFDLYALYNEKNDDRYWERVSRLNRQSDMGLMAYLGIEQRFWLMEDILQQDKTQKLSTVKEVCYAEAVDTLQQLSTAFSPLEKLKIIEKTFNEITKTVSAALKDDLMWCMDDLFPIFQFVVVRAKIHHLGAEIHMVDDLIEPHLEHGEFGLMFTTLKACYFQIQNEKMPHH